eukprot:6190933-Pleurochrysis_carterae.AAC.6
MVNLRGCSLSSGAVKEHLSEASEMANFVATELHAAFETCERAMVVHEQALSVIEGALRAGRASAEEMEEMLATLRETTRATRNATQEAETVQAQARAQLTVSTRAVSRAFSDEKTTVRPMSPAVPAASQRSAADHRSAAAVLRKGRRM